MAEDSLRSRRVRIQRTLATLVAGRGRRLPDDLQRRIYDYARDRLAAGTPRSQIGAELGVSGPTLVRLLRKRRFRTVRVTATPEPEAARAVVRGGHGVVVEGLDISGIAALLRELG